MKGAGIVPAGNEGAAAGCGGSTESILRGGTGSARERPGGLLLRAPFVLDLDHLVHVLAVLLDRLVVGFAEFHVGLVADLHLFRALGKVLDHRAGGRRHHGVAAGALLVVRATVVIVVGGLVHHHGLGLCGDGRDRGTHRRLNHRVAAPALLVVDAVVVVVLLAVDAHHDCGDRQRRHEEPPRVPGRSVVVGVVRVVVVGMSAVVAAPAVPV